MSAPATGTAALGSRFPALDGLRGLACYMVIATHVGFVSGRSFGDGPAAPWLSRFDVSVPIFLMLSGFLLYRPFAAHNLTDRPVNGVWTFWWRRALRVLPAYWLTIVVVLGVLSTRHATGGDWASYLGLVQIYDHHQVDPSLSQLWTLCVEISFYLALPFMAVAARRRSGTLEERFRRQMAVFATLFVLAVAFQVSAFHVAAFDYGALDWLPSILDWFVVGMFLAVLTCTPPECDTFRGMRDVLYTWAQSPVLCWTIALIALWFVTLPVGGPLGLEPSTAWQWLTRHHLETVVVFFLMLPVTLGHGGLIGRVLGSRPAKFFGDISYGLYLWHLAVLVLVQRLFDLPLFQGHYWEYFALTAGAATVLGTLSWYGFERPLLRRYSRPDFVVRRAARRETVNRAPAPAST